MRMHSRKLWYAPLLLACGAMLLLMSLAAIAFLVWLRPAAQDWQQTVQVGPLTLHVGVEKALRLASRREIGWLLDGRSIHAALPIGRLNAIMNAIASFGLILRLLGFRLFHRLLHHL